MRSLSGKYSHSGVKRVVERLAVGTLFPLSFTLVARLVGDLSEPGSDDQIVKWPAFLDSDRWALLAVLLVGPVAMVLGLARRPQTGIWRLALLVCFAAGSLGALFYRIAIARVHGANIGGVASVYLGLPFVVLLLGAAVWLFREADRDVAGRNA